MSKTLKAELDDLNEQEKARFKRLVNEYVRRISSRARAAVNAELFKHNIDKDFLASIIPSETFPDENVPVIMTMDYLYRRYTYMKLMGLNDALTIIQDSKSTTDAQIKLSKLIFQMGKGLK